MQERIFDVRNYGAVADGVTLCQKAVQNAVDDCHAQGGGTVRFEGGMYAFTPFFCSFLLSSSVGTSSNKSSIYLPFSPTLFLAFSPVKIYLFNNLCKIVNTRKETASANARIFDPVAFSILSKR